MEGIIIILGHMNNERGGLSSIAKERLRKGIRELKIGYKLLLTGGFGEHFNKTKKPHAYYSKQFLLKERVSDNDILGFVSSSNSVEDAKKSKLIVDRYGIKKIVVITSDFHLKRVKFIFEHIFVGYELSFVSSKTNVSAERKKKLVEHEIIGLEKLRENNFL